MKELLEPYVGQSIGTNVVRPNHIEPANLVTVGNDYFSLKPEGADEVYHIPFGNIVKIIENPDGITIKEMFHRRHSFQLVVKVGHVVEYVPM